jgi:hypothetical protein
VELVGFDRLFLTGLSPFGSVVEHSLGKGEVAGPIPAKGTIFVLLLAVWLVVAW